MVGDGGVITMIVRLSTVVVEDSSILIIDRRCRRPRVARPLRAFGSTPSYRRYIGAEVITTENRLSIQTERRTVCGGAEMHGSSDCRVECRSLERVIRRDDWQGFLIDREPLPTLLFTPQLIHYSRFLTLSLLFNVVKYSMNGWNSPWWWWWWW